MHPAPRKSVRAIPAADKERVPKTFGTDVMTDQMAETTVRIVQRSRRLLEETERLLRRPPAGKPKADT
jgi:hypothetical protein